MMKVRFLVVAWIVLSVKRVRGLFFRGIKWLLKRDLTSLLTVNNSSMAALQSFEVGATLAAFNVGS
jgi:hypothetical protein